MADLYTQSFEKFLSHTNEKQVFIDTLSEYITANNIHSLLDIGAGNGSLAIPLSKMVDDYLAVEARPKYAQTLRDAGLHVLEGMFPVPIHETYDLVLVSHIISHEDPNRLALVSAAGDLVNKNGHLLVVTHRGESDDDWSGLLARIGLNDTPKFEHAYDELVEAVGKYGKPKIERVITTVETESEEDMLQALGFVASNGLPERYERFMAKADDIKRILNEYRTERGFSFPFLHLFIDANKV